MGQAGVMLCARTFAAFFIIALNGCVAPDHNLLDSPATETEVIGTAPPIDERARFRNLFCRTLKKAEASAKECDAYLWHLPNEPHLQLESAPRSISLQHRARVLIVGGAFGDCFPPVSLPFDRSVNLLKEQGFSIDYISVSGRSSSEHNALLIAKYIATMPVEEDHPLVLLGYSKGVADILESLADPSVATRVSAVVSIAGAVAGSPLAARYAKLYNDVFSRVNLSSCPPDDGGVVRSLERSVRLSWLANHPAPKNVRYYSLATFATAAQIARGLSHTHRLLSKIDERNDGQLLAEDEIIPGSRLLGYANADHWAIALRMEDRFPFLVHRPQGQHFFPQNALLMSVLHLVQEDLDVSVASGP